MQLFLQLKMRHFELSNYLISKIEISLTHFDRECSIGNRFRLLSKFFERETLYKNHTK